MAFILTSWLLERHLWILGLHPLDTLPSWLTVGLKYTSNIWSASINHANISKRNHDVQQCVERSRVCPIIVWIVPPCVNTPTAKKGPALSSPSPSSSPHAPSPLITPPRNATDYHLLVHALGQVLLASSTAH